MRAGALGLVATGVAATLILSGCGSSKSGNTGSGSGGGSSTPTSAGATSGGSSSSAAPTSGGGGSSAAPSSGGVGTVNGKGGKVGIILPDTQSSARWVSSDPEALQAACKRDNLNCSIQNAQNDPSRMKTIAESMMSAGVKVLMIVNLDATSGAAIEKEAKSKGVFTIDYDRYTVGGSASLYVSFDAVKVGEEQGKALTQCSQVKGKTAVQYVDVNGSKTDSNAVDFKKGYDSVLSKQAGWKKVDDQWIAGWDVPTAGTTFAGMLQSHSKLNAVMVANDDMANAVITDLKRQKIAGQVAVSGQDTTVQGLQNILSGYQCFTIYKPSTGEADPAVNAAATIVSGGVPKTTQVYTDPSNKRQVPAILATPSVVTKANINVPIAANYAPKQQVCVGQFAKLCAAAGVK